MVSGPSVQVHPTPTEAEQYKLDPQLLQEFHREGFLILEGFVPREQLGKLRARAIALVDEFNPNSPSVFSTVNQAKTTDQYFLNSASNVSCFFEEKARDESGELLQPKAESINKIGHALHDQDPVFRELSRSPQVAALLVSLGYKSPMPVQSMYIFKQPRIGGEVVPHQDSTFLHTDPESVIGLWWALEDATIQNGCLWTLPGEHKKGVRRRMLRAKDDTISFDNPAPEYQLHHFVPIEVKAGSLVLLHGANVHYSKQNYSPQSRHAYSVHYIEGAPGVLWSPENWLQRAADDPFAPLSI